MDFLVYVSVRFLNMESTLYFVCTLQLGGPITACCEKELQVWKAQEGSPSTWTHNHELGEETTSAVTSNRNSSYIILPVCPYNPLTSTSTFDTQAYWCALGPKVKMAVLRGLSLLTTPFRLFTLVQFSPQLVLRNPIRGTAHSINKSSLQLLKCTSYRKILYKNVMYLNGVCVCVCVCMRVSIYTYSIRDTDVT